MKELSGLLVSGKDGLTVQDMEETFEEEEERYGQ